jgi:hypothetical protein
MTTAERNTLVLSLLEHVTPLIRKYATVYRLDFEETRQDASIAIMCLLDAGIDGIYDLPGYVAMRVKSRMIDKLRYVQRRQCISLDAPISQEEGAVSLADLLPCPYKVEPLTVLVAQERLQELSSHLAQHNPSRRRAIRERWETAAASL